MFTGEIQRSRSKKPFVIGGVLLLVVVAVALFMPFPRTVKSTFTLAGGTSTEVKAGKAGKVLEVVSASGKSVATGAPLLKLEGGDADQRVTELTAKLDALSKTKPAPAKEAAKSAAELKKAGAALKAAEKALAAAEAKAKAKGKKTPAVTKAEKKVKAATDALEKVKARARPGEAELKAQTEETQKALDAAKAEAAAATITAPVPGFVAGLRLAKGADVAKDDVVALIEGSAKLKAIVEEPAGQPLRKGMHVELLLDSGRKKLELDEDAKNGKAVAAFDNAKGELQPGLGGAVEISGDDTNLLNSLLGK